MSMLHSSDRSLDAIREPVEDELKKFDGVFRNAMRSQVALVDVVTRYILRQKGKLYVRYW